MNPVSLALWAIGAALVAIGYVRANGPWTRYRALREQQQNVERYEAWRGGLRSTEGERTGASVAMDVLRRQAQIGAAIGILGFVLIFLGFFL